MFKKSWVGCKFFEVFFTVYFLLSMHTTAFLMQWNFPYFLSHALVTVGCKKCLEFMSNALVILLGSSTYVFGMILGKNAWQSLFVLDLEVWEKPFNRFQIHIFWTIDQSIGSTKTKYIKLNTKTQFLSASTQAPRF